MPSHPSRIERRRVALESVREHLTAAHWTGRADQCAQCLSAKSPSFAICRGCEMIAREREVPAARFGTLVDQATPLYGAFMLYKRDFSHGGDRYRRMLSAILGFAFDEHESEIVRLLDGPPTMVSAVPSTKPLNALRPLPNVVSAVAALHRMLGSPLRFTGVARVAHTVQPDLFEATSRLDGERILLVEDLWVRGGTATSAVDAVETAGGRAVVLAIGREVRRDFMSSAELLRVSGRPSWMDTF